MRFRKKPVVIEAMQFTNDNKKHLFRWLTSDYYENDLDGRPVLVILTLEGNMIAQIGDWIIKGVNGEFYPCKPHIFEQTYEPVEDCGDST